MATPKASPRAGKARLRVDERFVAFLAVVVVLAIGVLFDPTSASAAPIPKGAPAPDDQCTTSQWVSPSNFSLCVGKISGVSSVCVSAPDPAAPDSGMPGWFADEPASSTEPGPKGLYSRYGYAGYNYTLYDDGCASSLLHATDSFENTMSNGEFMIATSVIGASNALRERAWDPASMWGWADPLVDVATRSLYTKVFTVFGAITLAVVGLYLMWRSRQSDMSNTVTTVGWALFVMVLVTAIASWPVRSAHIADTALVDGLNVVHSAVRPDAEQTMLTDCELPGADACKDNRAPAVIASDTATDNLIYRNWLRGLLGSADSGTAVKYGPVLYDAKSLSWDEQARIAANPNTRDMIIQTKQQEWEKVAAQIQKEDPVAYSYLQGNQGMDRVGAGFIAILSALFFAMFDITASVLVLIGFLIFRWAVIAAPVLGTFGLLRPASASLRRLANAVVAAIFNVVIFGAGAAVYLFAVDLIMSTRTLPGWLQVVMMWLVGVVGWLLLHPYRRITQLGGKDPTAAVSSVGSWHRRFFRDARDAARLEVVQPGGTAEPRLGRTRPVGVVSRSQRPETRNEEIADPTREAVPETARPSAPESRPAPAETRPAPKAPQLQPVAARQSRRSQPGEWTEPDLPDEPPIQIGLYLPSSMKDAPSSGSRPRRPTRRPESTPVSS